MLMLKPFFKYADFTGRARRSEYWLFQLFQLLIYLGILALLISGMGQGASGRVVAGSLASLAFLAIFALACFVPNLAVATRRLHDTGRSIWWLALYLPAMLAGASTMRGLANLGHTDPQMLTHAAQGGVMSIISAITNLIILLLMCLPGTRGANRFGPDPKGDGRDIAAVFDAPETDDDAAPAHEETPRSKPIFDFGPSPAKPASQAYTPPPRPATSGPAKPTFGKRR